MDQSDRNPSVTIGDAARLSGLSTHMITYLGRYDILRPSGNSIPKRGRARRFTFCDVVFLKVICGLLERGIEIKRLKASLLLLKEDTQKWIDIKAVPAKYLLTDGCELFVTSTINEGLTNISGQTAFSFLIDLGSTHKEVSSVWPAADKEYAA